MKASFVMYTDYARHWEILSGDEVKALDMAIFRYVETGELPAFTGSLQMAFSFVQGNLDRDAAKWVESKARMSEGGKKGMEARWGNGD
jgi:hypothetical protein